MTTLDDAAERDSAIAEAYDKWRGDELYFPSHHAIFGAGWIAATEAAAKKCEDEADRLTAKGYSQGAVVAKLRERAAAIRGKP